MNMPRYKFTWEEVNEAHTFIRELRFGAGRDESAKQHVERLLSIVPRPVRRWWLHRLEGTTYRLLIESDEYCSGS